MSLRQFSTQWKLTVGTRMIEHRSLGKTNAYLKPAQRAGQQLQLTAP